MLSGLEKQILVYCMQISRGKIPKGIVKMHIHDDKENHNDTHIAIPQLIEIISYITRIQENLYDFDRKRGFTCHIEISQHILKLIKDEHYDIVALSNNLPISMHNNMPSEINFHFSYLENFVYKKINPQDNTCDNKSKDIDFDKFLSKINENTLEKSIQKNIQNTFNAIERTIENIEQDTLLIYNTQASLTEIEYQKALNEKKSSHNYASILDFIDPIDIIDTIDDDKTQTDLTILDITPLHHDNLLETYEITNPQKSRHEIQDRKPLSIKDLIQQFEEIHEIEFVDNASKKT